MAATTLADILDLVTIPEQDQGRIRQVLRQSVDAGENFWRGHSSWADAENDEVDLVEGATRRADLLRADRRVDVKAMLFEPTNETIAYQRSGFNQNEGRCDVLLL